MNPAHFVHPSPVRSPLGASIGAQHCTSTLRRWKTSGVVAVLQTYIQIFIYYINYIIYIPRLCSLFTLSMQYAQITNSSSRHISMGNTAVERFCMVQQAAIAFGCPPNAPGLCKPQTAKENDFMSYCGFYHKTMRFGVFLFQSI